MTEDDFDKFWKKATIGVLIAMGIGFIIVVVMYVYYKSQGKLDRNPEDTAIEAPVE